MVTWGETLYFIIYSLFSFHTIIINDLNYIGYLVIPFGWILVEVWFYIEFDA